MYLDQRLKEHTLLQAIARTNRTYPRKDFGLVVDYVGIGRELAEALVIFEKEDLEGIFGVDDVRKELANLDYWHKKTLSFFDKIDLKRESRKIFCKNVWRFLGRRMFGQISMLPFGRWRGVWTF